METIDRDSILTIKAVVGYITDSSAVEQPLPFHAAIKRLFFDLVGAPHADSIFDIHRELQCFIQPEVSSDGGTTFVLFRINATADAIENAQVRILIEIVRQPADGECFKISVHEFPFSES